MASTVSRQSFLKLTGIGVGALVFSELGFDMAKGNRDQTRAPHR